MIYQLSDEYYVRALRESDLEGAYPAWFEDQDVCQFNSHGKFFMTLADLRAYFTSLSNKYQIVWAICHKDDGHIGNITLQCISFVDRNADFGLIIGDSRHWGKGVGYLASKTLFLHGFNKLNLQRIYCAAAASNTAMIKLAKKLGMSEEGCWRSHLYLDGAWVDLIAFGLLKNEFALIDISEK